MGVWIAIDFDGTIANTYFLQQQFCKTRYGIDLPLEASVGELRKQFLTDEQIREAKEYVHGAATLSAPLVPGARDAILTLFDAGHRIIILTGRVKAGAEFAEKYLRANRIPYDHLLFVSDDEKRKIKDGTILSKEVVIRRLKFDVMIDDQLKGLKKLAGSGVVIILLDQPWNRHETTPPGTVRIKGWPNVVSFLFGAPVGART